MPVCVAFIDDKIYIGHEAKKHEHNPKVLFVSDIKRKLEVDDDTTYAQKDITQIASLIIKEAYIIASYKLGFEVTKAIVTVPHFYNDK